MCWRCRKLAEQRTPHEGPGTGRKRLHTGRFSVCKMPKCGRKYELLPHQDKRFTWYCPTCRKKIAEITDGVAWLSRLGIEILVDPDGEEILMDSTAKAYDID